MCLVFILCISELVKYCSLLLDTNVSRESINCDFNGKMYNSLNKFLQDSLLLRPIIILIAFFWHPRYLNTRISNTFEITILSISVPCTLRF